MNTRFYYIAAITKLILGIFIILITYSYINIYEDPVIWISLWFIWTFIAIRWFSFFLFFRWQKIFRKINKELMVKNSYKLSLLFGIYCVINILLLMLWAWNKFLWFILLAGFIVIQIFLLENKNDKKND